MQSKIDFVITFEIYKLIISIVIKILVYLRKIDNIDDIDFNKF